MIRIANIEDSSRITEIAVFGWRCAYKDFISLEFLFNELTVKKREERIIESLLPEKAYGKTYVFEDENIIKGFMTIGKCQDKDKDDQTFELHRIYIDPIFQRQKIGTKLIEYCIEEAYSLKKSEIILWVFEKNHKTINFYMKMGFIKDRTNKLNEKFSENEIRMVRKL